ncbi:hypothetical protein RMCBS344292_07808 [Rhizopus microsporus]|nr:hypothetical protein RMCBS344292_07808 [Rhizopus microsporus]
MAEPDTTYFESLCEQLYNPKTPEEGEQVRKVLEQSFPIFGDSNNLPTETASSLRLLLSRSPNPFVQTFCLSRIKQLVQAQPNAFSVQVKIQLRTFLLEYAFIHPDLIPFVISQLGNVLAVVTLIGWAEVEEYKNIYKDISQFIQASIDHRIVGLQLLSILVQDMNPPSFTRNSSKYRKAAGEFRDTQLFDICEAAFKTLEEIVEHGIIYTHVNQAERLKEVTLNLLVRCFSYDFSGTSSDESGEDTATIQVPTSWRSLLEKDSFLPTFFKAYSEFEPPYSSKAMECLVQIASIRIALFTEPQRTKFIVAIMQGIRNIIVNTQGLDDGDNYNGFCRFLSRFRATVPLNEMVQTPGYLDWIELIANFSFKAFQSWKFAPNTSSYVLSFWTRLVQSMTYYQQLGEEAIEKLANLTIGIVQAYVSTALEAVPIRIEEGLDDPLENEDALIESLNHLGQIAHKRYQACSTALIELFNSITDQYQELINTVGINVSSEFKEALEVIETKYAWVVYIMGSFIGNRAAFMTSDNVDKIDSEITTKVLQLVDFQQSLLNQNGSTFMNEKLDLAIIFFFQMFKKSYMSESSGRDIYSILSEVFGISHQVTMLDVIMRKIISNLQHWADNETVIRRTLELFNDLNTG